jgi:hypothetical protein
MSTGTAAFSGQMQMVSRAMTPDELRYGVTTRAGAGETNVDVVHLGAKTIDEFNLQGDTVDGQVSLADQLRRQAMLKPGAQVVTASDGGKAIVARDAWNATATARGPQAKAEAFGDDSVAWATNVSQRGSAEATAVADGATAVAHNTSLEGTAQATTQAEDATTEAQVSGAGHPHATAASYQPDTTVTATATGPGADVHATRFVNGTMRNLAANALPGQTVDVQDGGVKPGLHVTMEQADASESPRPTRSSPRLAGLESPSGAGSMESDPAAGVAALLRFGF